MALKKAKRPTRDEFQLEELGERLVEAHQEGTELELHVWGEEAVIGRIKEMDSRTRLVHVLKRSGDMRKVSFLDIMKVESPGV